MPRTPTNQRTLPRTPRHTGQVLRARRSLVSQMEALSAAAPTPFVGDLAFGSPAPLLPAAPPAATGAPASGEEDTSAPSSSGEA